MLITDTVPETAKALLLSIELIGLAGFRRKFKNKSNLRKVGAKNRFTA